METTRLKRAKTGHQPTNTTTHDQTPTPGTPTPQTSTEGTHPVTIDEHHYGTWVETPDGDLGIIRYTTRWNEHGHEDCYLIIPTAGHCQSGEQLWDSDEITLRTDLPRAWTPSGQPPAGEWQTAKVKIIPNENARYDPERNVITGDAVADPDHEPRSSHDIRRWICEWEQIGEH